MALSSRQDLKEYALRALGAPVIQINVADEQLEDRLDEAVEYWRQYHSDGIEETYYIQRVTASELYLTTNNAEAFYLGGIITGNTSATTASTTYETVRTSAGNLLLVRDVKGVFLPGETITCSSTGVTAVLANPAYKLGVYDNKYIDMPNEIYGISKVIPITQASSSRNIFDLQYQLRLHDLYDVSSASMVYYKEIMTYISTLDFELNAKPMVRFNRFTNRLYIDMNWQYGYTFGDYLMIDCYKVLDPDKYSRMWGEIWLRNYVIALFKRQWGSNLVKFGGIQLPGGVTLNGQAIYNEGKSEIDDLERELRTLAQPLSWFVG